MAMRSCGGFCKTINRVLYASTIPLDTVSFPSFTFLYDIPVFKYPMIIVYVTVHHIQRVEVTSVVAHIKGVVFTVTFLLQCRLVRNYISRHFLNSNVFIKDRYYEKKGMNMDGNTSQIYLNPISFYLCLRRVRLFRLFNRNNP